MCKQSIMSITGNDNSYEMCYTFRHFDNPYKSYEDLLKEVSEILDSIYYDINIIYKDNLHTRKKINGLGNLIKEIIDIYSEFRNDTSKKFMLYFHTTLKCEIPNRIGRYHKILGNVFTELDYADCLNFIIRQSMQFIADKMENPIYSISISNLNAYQKTPLKDNIEDMVFNISLIDIDDDSDEINKFRFSIPLINGINNKNEYTDETVITYKVDSNFEALRLNNHDAKILDKQLRYLLIVYEYISNRLTKVKFINLCLETNDQYINTIYIDGNKAENFVKADELVKQIKDNEYTIVAGQLRALMEDKDLTIPSVECNILEFANMISKLVFYNTKSDDILIIPYWMYCLLINGKPFLLDSDGNRDIRTAIIPLTITFEHRAELNKDGKKEYKRSLYIRKYMTMKI